MESKCECKDKYQALFTYLSNSRFIRQNGTTVNYVFSQITCEGDIISISFRFTDLNNIVTNQTVKVFCKEVTTTNNIMFEIHSSNLRIRTLNINECLIIHSLINQPNDINRPDFVIFNNEFTFLESDYIRQPIIQQ